MARLAMNRTRSHVRAARSHRTLWILLGTVAVIVLAARFALSPVATWIANRKLGEMEGFDARVESVQIALWSGSVVVNDLRSEEHTSELQSRENLVCRLLLE